MSATPDSPTPVPTTTVFTSTVATTAPTPDDGTPRWKRLLRTPSAWLHPILVRDVRRAFRTRTYTATLTASCIAVLTIALLAVDREVAGQEIAQWTLHATLTAMLPVVLFAIPLQAHLSLRDEVVGHTADQLLLAGMRPAGILFGMLGTALLQCALFLGFFAPLLGFSYMLLGLDLRTLLLYFVLAPLVCSTAVGVGFASLRLRRWFGNHVTTLVVVVLGATSALAMQRVSLLADDLALAARSADYWLILPSWITLGLLLTLFLILLTAGALSPLRESRTVGFRLLGLAAMPTITLLAGAGVEGGMVAAIFALWIGFRVVTEPLTLGNRQRALVPPTEKERRRLAPFLPGSARGLLYVLTLAVACLASGVFTEFTFKARIPDAEGVFRLVAICGLVLAYASYGLHYRLTGVEQSLLATGQARMGLLARIVILWVAISIFDGMAMSAGRIGIALLSSINPLAIYSAKQALLPAPLLGLLGLIAGGLGVWLMRRALRFGFDELEAPGKAEVPAGLIREPPRRKAGGLARREAKRLQDRRSRREVVKTSATEGSPSPEGREPEQPPALPIDRVVPRADSPPREGEDQPAGRDPDAGSGSSSRP